MRFNCRTSSQEKRNLLEWHPWYAWHPVRIPDSTQCVWLERIERKGALWTSWHEAGLNWQYRLPGSADAL
jgi:hypothetical protein